MSSTPCPHCGQTHPEGATFCPNTGKPIPRSMPSPSTIFSRSFVIGIVGLVVILTIGIGSFVGGVFFAPRFMVTPTAETPKPTATPTLGIGSSQVSSKDGMTLMYVPAGTFTMGSSADDALRECQKFKNDCQRSWLIREEPAHQVTLNAFWIDKTEVTNKMYALCVASGACPLPQSSQSATRKNYYGNTQYNNYPVIHVSWQNANAYCRWTGRRLPTEAEWEKAARGTDSRIYPWGNTTPDANKLNFNHDIGDTTEVGSYPSGASPYGVMDMAGNVWEWVNDWYEETYYSKSPAQNPTGPVSGTDRAFRGTGYGNDSGVRASGRGGDVPRLVNWDLGFRCAFSQ